MANKRSADKQARVSVRRRANNQTLTSKAKTMAKKLRTLATEGKKEEAAKLLPELQSAYDKAAKKNSIHKNKASRIKARISKLLKK